jgi:hypothetical protein
MGITIDARPWGPSLAPPEQHLEPAGSHALASRPRSAALVRPKQYFVMAAPLIVTDSFEA